MSPILSRGLCIPTDELAIMAKVIRNGDKFSLFLGKTEIGYAYVSQVRSGEYILQSIDIDEAHQRKGWGTFLLKRIYEYLRVVGAKELHSSNEGSGTVQMLDKVFGRENVQHYHAGEEIDFENAKKVMDVDYGYTRSVARFPTVNAFVRSICKFGAYSPELTYLRDYLKAGVDPYDFAHLLGRFFDETSGIPDGFVDGIDYIERMSQAELSNFKKWLEAGPAHEESDPQSPSYLFLDYQKILRNNTWLVHFSDEVSDIETEGFKEGHPDERTLGLTTYFTSRKKQGPGWNFAFVAGSKDAVHAASESKYGKHAVMFQSAGVQAYHYGDSETQVIFRGAGVRELVPLYKDENGEWIVESFRDGRRVVKGDFTQVVNWITQNYAQYRRVIVRTIQAFILSVCKFAESKQVLDYPPMEFGNLKKAIEYLSADVRLPADIRTWDHEKLKLYLDRTVKKKETLENWIFDKRHFLRQDNYKTLQHAFMLLQQRLDRKVKSIEGLISRARHNGQ